MAEVKQAMGPKTEFLSADRRGMVQKTLLVGWLGRWLFPMILSVTGGRSSWGECLYFAPDEVMEILTNNHESMREEG